LPNAPQVSVLLTGVPLNSSRGAFAFCGVFLARWRDADASRVAIIDTGHVGLRGHLLAALDAEGLTPADVDLVALTHAHWDHSQNIDAFGIAEIAVSGAELDYIARPHARDLATPAWTRYLFQDRRVRRLNPNDDLLPGLRVVEAGGHSAGSVGFAWQSAGGPCLITGDAIPDAEVARAGRSRMVAWDIERADRAITRLRGQADVLYPGHDRPFRLSGGETEYLTGFDFALTGVMPGQPGLRIEPPGPLVTFDMTPRPAERSRS
jgi:glyoxylase-like metal-dependent hydrolase (beta-lactamase superfamily II)